MLRARSLPLLAIAMLLAALMALGLGRPVQSHAASSRPNVLVMRLNNQDIDPVTEEYVKLAIHKAEHAHDSALVMELDTPGGDEDSMKGIISAIIGAKTLPVIVYVYPGGGRAASAGSIITYASDYAAMDPETNIGAATPVNSDGSTITGTEAAKTRNDAVALVQSLAQSHHRNVTFAGQMVSKAASAPASKALAGHVVEDVDSSLSAVLNHANGFHTSPKGLTLHTANASVTHYSEPWVLRTFGVLINPNILYLLFLLGLVGILFEVVHPGLVAPGVVGVIALVCALFGFQVLAITATGAALVVVGVLLFGVEAFLPTHGILGIGGAISVVLGGSLLFQSSDGGSVSWIILVISALFLGLLFGLIVRKAIQARRAPVTTGPARILGELGEVRQALDPSGQIRVHGELWAAELADPGAEPIAVGRRVVVEARDGLRLRVRAADDAAARTNQPDATAPAN